MWHWESEAFGEEAASGTVTVNLRFPGQYFDQETNLHYNWMRYYSPQTGRYITSDPIGLEGSLNTYAYAYDNPVNFIDPYGEIPWAPVVTAGCVGLFIGNALNALESPAGDMDKHLRDLILQYDVWISDLESCPIGKLTDKHIELLNKMRQEQFRLIKQLADKQSPFTQGLFRKLGCAAALAIVLRRPTPFNPR